MPVKPQKIEQNKPQQSINNSREASLDKKKRAKGIKSSASSSKRCANCEFHHKQIYCPIHMLNTERNEVCNRFKHYFNREVYTGLYSPK